MKEVLRKHIEEIVPLTDEQFDIVFSYFKSKKLKKKDFLVKQGDSVNCEYFVVNGLVKAFYSDDEGKDHIMQFAMENWWVTDYQALLHKTPALLDIDCLEDTKLLCITLEDKDKLCAALHKMEYFFRKKSNSGYVALQRRILSLLNNDAKERYEQFMSLYPSLYQRVSKTLIAAYLGVTRETLSRLT
ncbi:Crp/Fnr family transcriptional regulator [Flavobacterium beibuense]|uniref:Crp/Fnr family transcriptional regulator n=1 Tax=Flavobacterium beibuense TaxID=657326 RepID=UPI003A8D7AE0